MKDFDALAKRIKARPTAQQARGRKSAADIDTALEDAVEVTLSEVVAAIEEADPDSPHALLAANTVRGMMKPKPAAFAGETARHPPNRK